jgi:DNA-binding transcriptional LysR family regulator
MNLEGIQLFILSAKRCNVTKAAQELNLSQSAASRKLKQLQTDVKRNLFRRSGRGIELTASGRRFLERVAPIMIQLEQATKSIGGVNVKSLTIGAARGPSAILLPSLMAKFKETHPGVQMALYPGTSTECLDWLVASRVDIALVTSPPSAPMFKVEPYRDEPLTAFVAANHPLAGRTAKAVELTDVTFVVRAGSPEPTRTEMQLMTLAKAGRRPTIAMRFGSSRSLKEAVRGGAGVGILHHDAVKREIERGEFKAISIAGLDRERKSYIVCLKEKPLSIVAQEFLSLLRASATQDSLTKLKAPQTSNGHRNGQASDSMRRS